VRLTQDNIKVELTATQYVGIHRYTFSKGKDVRIFLNAGLRRGGISSTLKDEYTIEGTFSGNYFVLQSDVPVRKTFVWNGERLLADGKSMDETGGNGIVCEFGADHQVLQLKVGLSFTGMEAARQNLEAGCPEWDFEQKYGEARSAWNEVLQGIQVQGSNEDDKTIFYTALYHTCLLPVIYSDVAGTYRETDCKIHQSKTYGYYGGYAFWDSFRTKYPLYSLYLPAVYRDIVSSLRDMYEQTEDWGSVVGSDHHPHNTVFAARGKGCNIPYSCRHEHMLTVMADACFKGLFDIDLQSVYPYIRKEAMLQMPEKYDSIGYIPARPDQTGEYCWDNWNVAQLAKVLGDTADYDYFMKQAQYWKNVWDPDIRFFRARAADGSWLDFPTTRPPIGKNTRMRVANGIGDGMPFTTFPA
jgi:predicted alpha-1,2-mannosidase